MGRARYAMAGLRERLLDRALRLLASARGVCRADETDTTAYRGVNSVGRMESGAIHYMECDRCGHSYEHVNGEYEYCPRCGRKVAE